MINMNCNPNALSFGRLKGFNNPYLGSSIPSNLSREQRDMVEHIEETVCKVAKNSEQTFEGVSKKELSELLEAQNKAIGKALIAVLDVMKGKDVDAYSVIQKSLMKRVVI